MQAIEVGTASDLGVEGPDYYLKNFNTLPPYYIKKREAKALGWRNYLFNLPAVAPGKMFSGDRYYNNENKLPSAPGRIWWEADIDYTGGPRNGKRVLYSNDGLLFVTFNHYDSFLEVIPAVEEECSAPTEEECSAPTEEECSAPITDCCLYLQPLQFIDQRDLGGIFMETKIIDFTGAKYLGELHLILKQTLDFPDFYGENLDALWDCLTGFILPCNVIFKGVYTLQKDLQERALRMIEVFVEAEVEYQAVFVLSVE